MHEGDDNEFDDEKKEVVEGELMMGMEMMIRMKTMMI